MTTVWCVGEVDYDLRLGLPNGVFATLEAAKASRPDVTWGEPSEEGEVDGRSPRGTYGQDEWVIAPYEVLA